MSAPKATAPSARRRRVLSAAAAGALLVATVVVVAVVADPGAGGTASAGAAAATGSPAAASSAAGGTSPLSGATAFVPTPGPTSGADALPASRPPVPPGATAAAGDGVTASLGTLEAVDASGSGPGNVAGPAVRVDVRLRNGTAAPVSLAGATVTMSYGPDQEPASPVDDPATSAFSGTLAPGATAVGTYVFTVPAAERSNVTVSVGYRPGAPYRVFTGAAS